MPIFLHSADWQIGRLYASLPPEDAVPLAEARIASVERLAELATEHSVDAVLVAGDVFDAQTVSDRTLRRLFLAMASYSGPWVLISGNHDAALTESVWTRAMRLGVVPANVHLALQPEPVLLDAIRTAVLPAPLMQRHTFGDSTAWFDEAATPDGWLRVGLAHGSVQGILPDTVDSANPIAADRAKRARLDYLALGDWHGTKRIDERTWYSGTPEPDRFRANDAGQALLVEISGPGIRPLVTSLPIGKFQWQSLAITVNVPTDVDQLLATLQALPVNTVLDIALQGQVTLADHQRLRTGLGEAAARIRHMCADESQLRMTPSVEDISALQADGYLADILAELRDEQNAEGEAAQIARDALALLSIALSQRTPVGQEGAAA
ncbi:metallophosphoesterase family protein [Roseateles toxinivorans]|uniref:DNA repair exonuclease SbcCD nuclease subunit n=1 Tax=Roseateles toxinivorans TaxID=270368 RepID=A0A4R6QUY9_9BURK|nr:DNA repair exonuclease [Roseateles toxinivorans]TDP74745.1 DNA repair exonuclease SbcCD nuclease subunit [Roseateles toxinivorans]